ncbi:Fic family protein [Sediminibacterium soli]|uniref:Fic family protein n=1 Tax=Sediminibacterium soli TaxID=2698829 RepID=UPI00137B4292|nr:Fic family protein [Sediminibacterium soli]NCI47254.1 Fic family protein [Sediminibacterium soli]
MNIHTLVFKPANWMQLTQELSQLDRFDAKWQAIERREQQTLKELKSIATVRSVGASTRIEGSVLTDKEVETLIGNLDIAKLTERDQQEVAGYYETLNLITESYRDIPIAESSIKHLHNTLLQFSSKDGYHKGNYKTSPNRVEKTMPDETKIPVFETSAPGWATRDAVAAALQWYNGDHITHALIKTAILVYEFLSIHPFQDGNGRLSRLLTTLLLMKSGYVWIEYVSFEHEIENRKKEYYQRLMEAQRNRPGENVTEWVYFFLDCLRNIQVQLMQKLDEKKNRESVGVREQHIYNVVENNPGIRSGEIAEKLQIPLPTVKRVLSEMVNSRNLVVHGAGRGTTYSIAATDRIKRDMAIVFSNKEREKEFVLPQLGSFVRIKKIVLTTLFDWKHPDEWGRKLMRNGLYIVLHATTSAGMVYRQTYVLSSFNNPSYFQPVFIVTPNIVLPDQMRTAGIQKLDYPIRCKMELSGSVDVFDFNVMLVTDEG